MSGDELAALQAWAEAGFVEGDETDYRPPNVHPTLMPDAEPDRVVLPAESYVPDTAITDEYRCFITEDRFEHDTYLWLRFDREAFVAATGR